MEATRQTLIQFVILSGRSEYLHQNSFSRSWYFLSYEKPTTKSENNIYYRLGIIYEQCLFTCQCVSNFLLDFNFSGFDFPFKIFLHTHRFRFVEKNWSILSPNTPSWNDWGYKAQGSLWKSVFVFCLRLFHFLINWPTKKFLCCS